ncbi:protein-(glutamine-N5) methyltransferase, release factor-specific [Arachidicoccus ginsenosidimutans]|uniref:peptide chain release factor N(5)-glutamine methyltransferase n=1 Tax=Arachidicoccus sp. BS20 TaxID=1850526 RepID=UPI0007F17E79|nr:peptide chain release factor N(5)-glutamine methyltransferase [Arachidicoccus sp. BS20]ANI88462.1 protein-(glutamine-N5) methyltransferase, release factor-specific [Arachidicoccus sp. BS20]
MTIYEAQQTLTQQLKNIYDTEETPGIADLVLEKITHQKRIDRLLKKDIPLSEQEELLFKKYTSELLQHRPVQYVLEEAHFYGLDFFVNENVLIPRPETEELVDWICKTISQKNINDKILDIGTGSGIIPVSIKNKFPSAKVSAIDISSKALEIAKQNAANHHTEIGFYEMDILDEKSWHQLNSFDIIVSNPPYIRQTEKNEMNKNVLEYEPHTALFVPDEKPLLFYETIAKFSTTHLSPKGYLFFEINENLGQEVVAMLQNLSFNQIELRKDFQGKDRMVKCMFKK